MRMRNDVDSLWINLVKYFGMAPPAGTTQTELENWARPDTPHPARKNRPQLYALLISARSGTLASHESDMVSIPGGEICLGTIHEFKALLNAQPTSAQEANESFVLEWVETFSPRSSALLSKLPSERFQNYVDSILEFHARDADLHQRSTSKYNRFVEEKQKIDEVRLAVLEVKTDDTGERLRHLDEFTEYVLAPLAQSIQTFEQIRGAYLEHIKKQTLDFVMATAGITIQHIDFPGVDEIESLLNDLPRFEDAAEFEQLKTNRSYQIVTDKIQSFVDDINEKFDAHVDLDAQEVLDNLRKNKFSIQINQCYGGVQKTVQMNTENIIH